MNSSPEARDVRSMRQIVNRMYQGEVWMPLTLRPDAVSPTRHDAIARLIRNERGRVLEVGCGAGQMTMALADQFERLIGVDISEVRIDLANRVLRERSEQYQEKVNFQCVAPNAPLPFADNSVDVVIASVVLEVVPDVFFTMDEMARVCRPGGCVAIAVANVCYLKHLLGMLAGRIPITWTKTRDMARWRRDGWDGGALRYFSKSALGDLLRHTGFEPEVWSGCGTLARLRRWYLNSCSGLTVRARRVKA